MEGLDYLGHCQAPLVDCVARGEEFARTGAIAGHGGKAARRS